jgi:hypothetical protein
MAAIFGEGTGYVPCPDPEESFANDEGPKGRSTYFVPEPCEECPVCVLGGPITDPVEAFGVYYPISLACFPFALEASATVPDVLVGFNSGPSVQVGFSRATPPSAYVGDEDNSIRVQATISQGGGDIPFGTPYCQISYLDVAFLGNDNSLYVVPGTYNTPGPYSVTWRIEGYLSPGPTDLRYRYFINGVQFFDTSGSFLYPHNVYHTIYTTSLGNQLTEVASIDNVVGC